MNEALSFRWGERRDIPLIMEFVKALAVHEKQPEAFVADPAVMEEWLFDKKAAEVLFAVEDGKEVGFALFFQNFSTFLGKAGLYLQNLYVSSSCRGKGYGKVILQKLAQIAVERGYGRMEWSCMNDNVSSVNFYLAMGAKRLDNQRDFRLVGESLQNVANGKK